MSGLAELQQQFLAHLRGDPGAALDGAIAEGRLPSRIGLRIYVNAYSARLSEALEHDHPALARYLGDALWSKLCAGYIRTHPSRHRSLRDFGADLPTFLRGQAPFDASPQIAELAQFERGLLDSFDAADDLHASWSALLAIDGLDWPRLQPQFHPSLRLHQVQWNSVEIWRALKQDDPQTPPAAQAQPGTWALWRDQDRVGRFRSLEPEEAEALVHCMHANFAGLCALLLQWHSPDTVPARALQHLQRWCAEGWISRWQP